MKKVAIHIFHDDESSLGTGAHVSERVRRMKDARGVRWKSSSARRAESRAREQRW